MTPYLSIIIPAYNESRRIGKTLDHLAEHLKHTPYTYEVIVVDDGSRDNTVGVVRSHMQDFEQLSIIQNVGNRGKGFSVRNGMLHARGDLRLFMDADDSVDITHVHAFIEQVMNGNDVVIGSIKVGDAHVAEHAGSHRRILGNLSKMLIHGLLRLDVLDTQRGFKLFTARAAESIFPRQTIDRFGFDIEILLIAHLNGFYIKEMPVRWENAADSKVTFTSYFATLRELITIVRTRNAGAYNNPLYDTPPSPEERFPSFPSPRLPVIPTPSR